MSLPRFALGILHRRGSAVSVNSWKPLVGLVAPHGRSALSNRRGVVGFLAGGAVRVHARWYVVGGWGAGFEVVDQRRETRLSRYGVMDTFLNGLALSWC